MSNAAIPLFSIPRKDLEGLILVDTDGEIEQSFVVDCPSLHIIPASTLEMGYDPRGSQVWFHFLILVGDILTILQ